MGMAYHVKELFYSLQGEGRNAGRAAVFCRFVGCNLWSGRESDRATAVCKFCDTDFVGTDGSGGGSFSGPRELVAAILRLWPREVGATARPLVVCTGGEPLLQMDAALVEELRASGFEVAIETNGTVPLILRIDWVCVSPKAKTDLVVRGGNELKLIFPQEGGEPSRYAGLDFQFFYLQPMDGVELSRNTRLAVEYCLAHPQWRLSLQTQKILNIP